LHFENTTPKPSPPKYKKNPITIGEHIRKRRVDLGIYQSEVGRHFGVSKDCITNWENGRSVPQISHYPKIISFLGYNSFKNGEKTLGEKTFAYRCANE